MKLGMKLAEQGLLPDFIVRYGIRNLLEERRVQIASSAEDEVISQLQSSKLAVATDEANNQHYMVPTEFYSQVLGDYKKYSCCYYDESTKNLSSAEKKALDLVCERAELENSQEILELGCGWGSFSLYAAKKYPNSKITAVSNSKTQKIYIDGLAKEQGIQNLQIITEDINNFSPANQFDRIVSIEMFEHVRNYEQLFGNINKWLNDSGKIFIHVFCHKDKPYLFEEVDESDWMSKYFFTGGVMPSLTLFDRFKGELSLQSRWKVSGTHYQKTAEDWLKNLYQKKSEVMPILEENYPSGSAKVWFNRWRIFFLSCSELFGYKNGEEWLVGHYLYSK